MEPLPAQSLPAVPHIIFGIFNLAIPNIIAWGVVWGTFVLAIWTRLPRFFEPVDIHSDQEVASEPHR